MVLTRYGRMTEGVRVGTEVVVNIGNIDLSRKGWG